MELSVVYHKQRFDNNIWGCSLTVISSKRRFKDKIYRFVSRSTLFHKIGLILHWMRIKDWFVLCESKWIKENAERSVVYVRFLLYLKLSTPSRLLLCTDLNFFMCFINQYRNEDFFMGTKINFRKQILTKKVCVTSGRKLLLGNVPLPL